MKKALKALALFILFVLVVWFVVSFVDIVADNSMPNPIHHPLNLFVLLFP